MANETLEDVLGQLDATSARGRQQDIVRGTSGAKLPTTLDNVELPWRPIPKLDDVRHTLKAGASKRFICHTRTSGVEFQHHKDTGYLKPKVLDLWTAGRLVQPNRSFKKGVPPSRFHAQSEPFEEPTDELCEKSHYDWLQKHHVRRKQELYPLAHALDNIEKAEQLFKVHEERRQQTRDIVTRLPSDGSGLKFGQKAKAGLAKVRSAVRSTQAFNKLADRDESKEEERRDEQRVLKAKSAPILQHAQPPPAGQVQHLRSFGPSETALRNLRLTTPWQHNDEMTELKQLRRTW